MDRLPLPPEHDTLPRNAADVMFGLHEQTGLPLQALINLDLQSLHDVVAAISVPEDADAVERLVIVDEETIGVLDRVVTAEIARARPDRRIERDGYGGWIDRSRATAKVPSVANGSLAELDAALDSLEGGDQVVLEDEDYRRVSRSMNAAISKRPHGRSPTIDGGVPREDVEVATAAALYDEIERVQASSASRDQFANPGYDVDTAGAFIAATEIAMSKGISARGVTNPRALWFYSALAGYEKQLVLRAATGQVDILCLGFTPGAEGQGPSNFAIYEVRDGNVNAWIECDPFMTADRKNFVLRSRLRGVCFAYDGRSLVVMEGRPPGDLKSGIARGRAEICRIAAALRQARSSRLDA